MNWNFCSKLDDSYKERGLSYELDYKLLGRSGYGLIQVYDTDINSIDQSSPVLVQFLEVDIEFCKIILNKL